MPDWFITLLTALGGGGAVAAILTYLSKSKDQKKDFFEVIANRLDKDIIRLNQELATEKRERKEEREDYEAKISKFIVIIEEKNKTIDDLKQQNLNYKSLIMVLESGMEYLPFPYWLKDSDGIMLNLNAAYEKAFLFPLGFKRTDYIGYTDGKIWGKDVARRFQSNDRKAAKADDNIWLGKEDSHNVLKGWRFLKFSRYSENQLIGVGGIAIREEEFNSLD